MSVTGPHTAQQISELVMSNRVIRAPNYQAENDEGVQFTDVDRGLQWGADVIPALLGLFRVEQDPRTDHPDGWVGFARHWRGATMRVDFDMVPAPGESDPILVVTAITSRSGEPTIDDEDFGEIDVGGQVPTEEEWTHRDKKYHAARRKDTSDGSAAVQAFIAALPAWQSRIATQFDHVIQEEVPTVRRAVRYHQPFYGVEDSGWFASFGAFSKHVKLTFVCGSPLDPEPPSGTGPARQALDLKETDAIDEDQIASWIRQAAEDPGMNW